jgi:micrococcal nuclease
MGLILSATDSPAVVEATGTYGNASVSKILRIDQTCTIFCDIKDFPAIIGKDMPVKINGLKTANAVEYNLKIQKFLNELLLTKMDTPKKVTLKNIRRGEMFCFLADIEIDGKDVCDLLVANGLAQRIIEVKTPKPPQAAIQQASQINARQAPRYPYMASKTSKIFHRVDCSHAKRIDAAKAIYFSSRQEAVRTGRQPCKTCNP